MRFRFRGRVRCVLLGVLLATGTVSGQQAPRSGIDRAALDESCKPCDDFWRYANGGWLDRNPIPSDRATWGPFNVLTAANKARLRAILESAGADGTAPEGSSLRKIGDFYASCMDTATIDARGVTPLQPDFDRIDRIANRADLVNALIAYQGAARPFNEANGAVVGAFRVTTGPDPKSPERTVVLIVERDQPGRRGTSVLSMPDRDYYVKEDADTRRVRHEFVGHVTRALTLAGTPLSAAGGHAETILAFERALAESILPLAVKRNPDTTYHPVDLTELAALAPAFDWRRLLIELGASPDAPIVVTEPELLKRFNEQLTTVPVEDWKAWLRWRVIKMAAPYV